ncbi:MAG: type II toxin-antitoxin system RelE/ParE family toxin [archaeon]
MILNIDHSNKSKRFLKKCDISLTRRIMERIERLAENPFPSDCKRVIDRKEKTFRIRVGDYRILYSVYKEKNLLFISDIDKRPRVFD